MAEFRGHRNLLFGLLDFTGVARSVYLLAGEKKYCVFKESASIYALVWSLFLLDCRASRLEWSVGFTEGEEKSLGNGKLATWV